MKRMFMILSLCAAAAGLTGCAGISLPNISLLNFGTKAQPVEVSKNGRYQLATVPGTVAPNMPTIYGTVIKMDSMTGETWYGKVDSMGNVTAWSKMSN